MLELRHSFRSREWDRSLGLLATPQIVRWAVRKLQSPANFHRRKSLVGIGKTPDSRLEILALNTYFAARGIKNDRTRILGCSPTVSPQYCRIANTGCCYGVRL